MPRHPKTLRLNVWMNGERVGQWTVEARGRHRFHYEKTWLGSPGARPISLSTPLRPPDVPYDGPLVEAFFDLLAAIGRDCVGAIQLLPPEQTPEGFDRIQCQELTIDGIANELRSVVSAEPLGQHFSEPFRISIAGAQEKTAFLRHEGKWQRAMGATPSTHMMLGSTWPAPIQFWHEKCVSAETFFASGKYKSDCFLLLDPKAVGVGAKCQSRDSRTWL